jgi:DNA-binding response OmpR family regulator
MDRHVPLIVIGSVSSALADRVAQQLRRDGNVVYVTHSAEGCLRVATSVRADVILLDPSFPSRLEKLLRAHPSSKAARILHLTEDVVRPSASPRPVAA